MKKYRKKGLIDGIIAAISYGTNPLFFLPCYKLGMSVNSILFYRYFFAVVIYGIWLKFFKKTSFKISLKELFWLFFMGVIFALSSITLFESFKYIDSGIACTILFIYPVIVALISAIFFREKINKTTILAMFITLLGIFLLNNVQNGGLNPKGAIFVLLSALTYAVYIIFVKYLKPLKHIKYDKLSFYVMLFGMGVFAVNLKFCTQLQPINDWRVLGCSLALAIFPTIVSIETINIAIRLIGSTLTAILGALEPLTAIFFGVLVFGEVLYPSSIVGIILVLSGVLLIILKDNIKYQIKYK